MENLKYRIIDDLNTTIEMIKEIDTKLNTEKQAAMLSRMIEINIVGLNRKTYERIKDIKEFHMKEFGPYYENYLELFISHHKSDLT